MFELKQQTWTAGANTNTIIPRILSGFVTYIHISFQYYSCGQIPRYIFYLCLPFPLFIENVFDPDFRTDRITALNTLMTFTARKEKSRVQCFVG